jgi:hypothetical protein
MNEEAVEPQVMDEILDEAPEPIQEEVAEVQEEPKTMVPLSALQKERDKRKEAELQAQWERQERERMLAQKAPVEEDNSRYESATKEDVELSQARALKAFEERLWMKQNPEKVEELNELLPTFLKQRPHLARAIEDAPNRYEEAYLLMNALSPKQQTELKKAVKPKAEAPNSPGSVPKSAVLNDAVDVMNMSDKEFAEWRASKKRRR